MHLQRTICASVVFSNHKFQGPADWVAGFGGKFPAAGLKAARESGSSGGYERRFGKHTVVKKRRFFFFLSVSFVFVFLAILTIAIGLGMLEKAYWDGFKVRSAMELYLKCKCPGPDPGPNSFLPLPSTDHQHSFPRDHSLLYFLSEAIPFTKLWTWSNIKPVS